MGFVKGVTPPGAKPFKKGQTGNPNGRPKKLPELDDLLADILGGDDEQKSDAQTILEEIVKKAKKGDLKAAEMILDRAYGKPLQRTENTNRHTFDADAPETITPEKIAELERILGNGKRDNETGTLPGKRKGQK